MKTNLAFVIITAIICGIDSFSGKGVKCIYRSRRLSLFSGKHKDPEYIKALQEAAKNSKTFEDFIARQSIIENDIKNNREHEQGETDSNSTLPLSTEGKAKGYIPIELWDKEQKELLKEMSWEQRVQYEGQKNGDQFRQNEILRKNLKTF